MSAVRIVTRTTKGSATKKSEKRYLVYYRRGGQGFPEEYAGSFTTPWEAKKRRDVVAGELAAGRDPRTLLEELRLPLKPKPGLELAYREFMASRVDVSESTADLYETARRKLVPLLGPLTVPAAITVGQVQEAVNVLISEGRSPLTIRQYVGTLGQVLDFADVTPNPVRSPKLRRPALSKDEVSPPSTTDWQAMLAMLPRQYVLLARVIECLGLRSGEALKLTWGDIDWTTNRIRVSRARTKTRSGQRWLPVPDELLDLIDALVPLEDRDAEAAVFPFTYNALRLAVSRAVKLAGVASFSPHALRHRRISLWFAHGVDEIQVAAWSGHARASMSQDVYGHVLIDAGLDEWKGFWCGWAQGAPTKDTTTKEDSYGLG